MVYYISAIAIAIGVFLFLFLLRKRNIIPKLKSLTNERIVAGLYAVLFFVRYFGGKPLIQETLGLNVSSPFGAQGGAYVVVAAIMLWLLFTVQLVLVLHPIFEKHVPLVTPIVRYVNPVVYLAALVTLPIICQALDGSEGVANNHWRLIIFSLEVGVGFGYSVFRLINGKHKKPEAKKALQTGLIFLGMFFMAMPVWIPQCFFGLVDDSLVPSGFNIYHRILLYGSIVFALGVHFLFTRCTWEQKRYALLYISMAGVISYCYNFDFAHTFIDMSEWPLHLCNTALFIAPIVLFFKADKLYYFTLFINVLGAFLAMVLPDVAGQNIIGSASVKFWLNHYLAMIIPIVTMSLRIFPRPNMKTFIYSLVAFMGYYILVLVANSYFTAHGKTVDFFFINSDFISSKLGSWADDTRDVIATINIGGYSYVLYPLYQSLYFLVYVALSFAMWFLYEQFFQITDVYRITMERSRKIKADRLALEVYLAGRSMKEPKNPQNEGKLILRNFSKRYSTSDVYAVYDANLEIEGGQIFGFLGPNGAGKSTIIKSIVGIQTITSGEIEVSGYDVDTQSVGAKMQIGFVPDHYALYENLTGREYVNYIADLYGVEESQRDERVNDYVARFRLEGAIDNPIKTYSHGMKQKITIMSALVHNPRVWILDEPLTGLDPESIFQVKECMKEHAAKGNIVFFSSHIIDVVERICDKIAIIRKGQILCTKTVAEIDAMGIPLEQFYMETIDGNTQAPVPVKQEDSTKDGKAKSLKKA